MNSAHPRPHRYVHYDSKRTPRSDASSPPTLTRCMTSSKDLQRHVTRT